MFEEYKYHITGLLFACTVVISLIMFFGVEKPVSAKSEVIIKEKEPERTQHIQKDIQKEEPKVVIKKEAIVEENEKVMEYTNEVIIEDNSINLTTSKVLEGNDRYFVKVLADKNITSERNMVRFIPIIGKIEKDNASYPFKLSLEYDYSSNWEINLNLQIVSSNEKEKYDCDGSFLKGLDINFAYEVMIYLNNYGANCYLSYQEVRNIPHINPEEFKFEEMPKAFYDKLLEMRKASIKDDQWK